MTDLVVWVPDKNIEATLDALMQRPESLGIRKLDVKIFTDMHRDPGCFKNGAEHLAGFRDTYSRGLLVFDHAWDGCPAQDAVTLEAMVREKFNANGIGDWAEVVVLEPELEIWAWTDSPHLPRLMNWDGNYQSLREWLQSQDLWAPEAAKPGDPKLALETALYRGKVRRSSSFFRDLARDVSFKRCQDPSFLRLREILGNWFPQAAIS
jgi:hypothetical protein